MAPRTSRKPRAAKPAADGLDRTPTAVVVRKSEAFHGADGLTHALKPGDVVEVPRYEAEARVADGRAQWPVETAAVQLPERAALT